MTWRERWVEFRENPKRWLARWVAFRLPRSVVHWALVRVFSEAAVVSGRSAGGITVSEAIQVWDTGRPFVEYPGGRRTTRRPSRTAAIGLRALAEMDWGEDPEPEE